ncbi:MAG TPA: PD-(D/E)XK nuclease family protein [Gammaproteobacteria bacterium]|nr:PD-(D/E)XK nuclease family protein [Gammaproteobacteria bacterium]
MNKPPSITILTANQRLSAYLRKQYDSAQQSQNLTTWLSLDCLPLSRWLIRTFETLADNRLILTEAQELALWEKIITTALNINNDFVLLRPFATAQTASEAWHLLKQWQLPLTLLKNSASEDIQYFYQWAQTFENICKKQQWLTPSDCTDILMQAVKNQSLDLPEHLIFAGFEELLPQTTQLCEALASCTHIHILPSSTTLLELLQTIDENKNLSNAETKIIQPLLYSIGLLDTTQELRTMALWAKKTLQNHPQTTLGCVVPDLNLLRNKVERIFNEVFTSENKETPSLPFNLSAGLPLNKYPLIQAAFTILQLASPELNIEQISHLLRSPFIGGAESERIERAMLDIALRQSGERFLTLENVFMLSQRHNQCPLWIKLLTTFSQVLYQQINAKHPPSTWAHFFIQLLESLQWPGERALNSAEFQQWQRWQTLLTEFCTLDLVINQEINLTAACHHLQHLAQRTLFQPQSKDAPIQILGLLEAAGMQFDQLWVMGMNDESWPKSAAPNPFIPILLQRQHHMPHASAERELAFSQKLTTRFTQSAKHIIFSYSQRSGDLPLRKSRLISAFDEVVLSDLIEPPQPRIYDPDCLELIQDEYAPPVLASEMIRGGASVLKNQAACPFSAFAKIRLGATQLPEITSGLSAMERGTLLHEILESLWETLDNKDTLQSYNDAQLTTLVHSLVTQTLLQKAKKRPLSLKSRFIKVETQRLTQLITEWLQLEKQRPFFRVIARESLHKIHFAGLELSLRIDREDELADGSRLIVDYKTGLPRIEDWFGERPDDPQLPLYCLTSAHPIQGLLFAQIRISQSQFKGISAKDIGMAGVKPIMDLKTEHQPIDWEQFQRQQRDILGRLAQDFLQGYATVDPKKTEETCRNCELQMLCRKYEGN